MPWPAIVMVALVVSTTLTLAGVMAVLVVTMPGTDLLWQVWRTVFVDGTVVIPSIVGGTIGLSIVLRPVTPHTIRAWLLKRRLPASVAESGALELRRLRAWRAVPAFAGFFLGMGPLPASELATTLGRSASPALDAAVRGAWPDSLSLALAGYLLGTVVCELFRRRPAAPPAGVGARLEVRRPARYLTRTAHWLPDVVAGAIVAMLVVRELAGVAGSIGVLLALATAAGLTLGVRAVQWWVVRRPQQLTDPGLLALDDTLRSSTAHAIVGAAGTSGVLVVATLFEDLDLWNAMVAGEVSRWLAWPLVLLSAGLTLAILGVWLHYGSSHAGTRPQSEDT